MPKILDGKKIAMDIKNELKIEIENNKNLKVTLAVIIIGDDEASKIYVRDKVRACEYIGINSKVIALSQSTTQDELLRRISILNADESVNGILVQLPLPKHIDEKCVIFAVDHSKDVDCFHPINVGILGSKNDGFKPCTPSGIIELLKRYNIPIAASNCVIVGRSNIVGRPLSSMLTNEDATVTLCHSKTKNLEMHCNNADILVSAVGKAAFITESMVKDGAVIIDVGMNRNSEGKLCGDVDFENCSKKSSYITPVPGGVGPMTIAILMKNCYKAAIQQMNKE